MTPTVKSRLSTELIGPSLDFRLSDGKSKVFRHTKGFNVPLLGRRWKSFKKQLWDDHKGRAQLGTGERQQWEGPPPFQATVSHLLPDSTACHPRCWIPPKSQKANCTAPSNSRLVLMADVWFEITRRSKEFFTKGSCSCVLLMHVYARKQLRYQRRLSDA